MRLIDADALKKAITDATYNFEQIPIRVDKVQEIIDNAPTVEPRTEYGTDGQAYRLFISGGQVVPDMLQGWKYEERPQDKCNCSNCDYFKFSQSFIDNVVKFMTDYNIETVEDLMKELNHINELLGGRE